MNYSRLRLANVRIAGLRLVLGFVCGVCLWGGTLCSQAQYDLIHLGTLPSGYGNDVAVDGGYAFVASYTAGICVFDISDPWNPSFVTCTNSGIPYVYDASITTAEGHAYTGAIRDTDLHVYSISNPTNPFPVTNVYSGNNVADILVDGELGYVANTSEGFSVFDFSDPAIPLHVTNFPGTSASCIALAGGWHAYVGGYDPPGAGTLRVYSLADPSAPVEVGGTNSPWVQAIAVRENCAYLAHPSGVAFFDISTPSSPHLVAPGLAVGRVEDLLVSGHYLFAANWSSGVRMYDISDPFQPIEISHVNTTGYAPVSRGLCMSGNYLFVASGNTGFYICAVMPRLQISVDGVNQPCISWPQPFGPGVAIEQRDVTSAGEWVPAENAIICTNGYCSIRPTESGSCLYRLRMSP